MSVAAEKVSTLIVEELVDDYELRVRLTVEDGRVLRIDVSYRLTWSRGTPTEFSIELGDDEVLIRSRETSIRVKDPSVRNIWFKNAAEVIDGFKRNGAETVNDIIYDVRAMIGRVINSIEIDR